METKKLIKILKNFFDKVYFIIEFICSIILTISILNILTTKVYYGYIPLNKLIYAIISFVIVLICIIYNCKTQKGKIEKIFIGFAIPIAIGYGILILPLNVPDEGSHIFKAYDISLGNIFSKFDENGEAYTSSIKEFENYSYARFQSYNDVYKEVSKITNYSEKIKVISATQGVFPILYVTSSIAFVIGRLCGLNFFIVMYIARMFNILLYLIFGYFTIKKIPIGKILMSVYLCMPMMLQQAASCSYDAILNAVLLFYIAHLIYLVFKKEERTKKDKIILYILTALMSMFKYVYILIAGILFIKIFDKKENKKEILKVSAIMIIIGALVGISWMMFSSRFSSTPDAFKAYYEEVNVDSVQQLDYIKGNIFKFGTIFVKEFVIYGQEYIFDSIGQKLGWLEINVNQGIIVLYLILLIITTISEKNKFEFNLKSKLWIMCLIFAIISLINIVMYLQFTPVGYPRICGVQGRYFTPIFILILLCMIRKEKNYEINNLTEKAMSISFILNYLTLTNVIINYL